MRLLATIILALAVSGSQSLQATATGATAVTDGAMAFSESQMRNGKVGDNIVLALPTRGRVTAIVLTARHFGAHIALLSGKFVNGSGTWSATVFRQGIDLHLSISGQSIDVSRGRGMKYFARIAEGTPLIRDSPKEFRRNDFRRAKPISAASGHKDLTILVVYTTKAVAYFEANPGDPSADAELRRHIMNAIDYTNVAFSNSDIDLTLRPIVQRTSFAESDSLSHDLDVLADDQDANGGVVRTARADVKAQLVMIVRGVVDPPEELGLSWELENVDQAYRDTNKSRAFSEVQASCIDQWYHCFAHEVGHALGAGHDVQGDDGIRMYPDGFGYEFTANGSCYADLMAYACADNRVPYYSNPAVQYMGHVFGTAQANNARAIRDAKDYVATYWQ